MDELNTLEHEIGKDLCAHKFYTDKSRGFLDLSGLGLTEVPQCISSMHWIEELDVSDNHLTADDMSCIPPGIRYISDMTSPEPTPGGRMLASMIMGMAFFFIVYFGCSVTEVGAIKWAIAPFCACVACATIALSDVMPVVVGFPLALIICDILPWAWAHGEYIQWPSVSLFAVVAAAWASRCQ